MSGAAVDVRWPRRRVRGSALAHRAWMVVSAGVAGILGLLPHVLHHAGPLAGAALFAGVGGSLLFGALGFVAAVPFLLRIRHRCGNWRVPSALLAAMAVIFSLSAFVVGPAITGGGDRDAGDVPPQPAPAPGEPAGHKEHH